MISASNAVRTATGMIRRLKPGYRLELLSFKKDRSVTITRLGPGSLVVAEAGFEHHRWEVGEDEALRLLRDAIDREFPRSHQLRFSVRQDAGAE
ncbi:MAG: hypothetical protein OWV35_09185 [Firmicutes bacterium]|nr:hypothetical protein [Bacillota bacterium]